MMKKIYSFAPIENKGCESLIVGTMPGKESLKLKQYYANKDNLFWDIMARICHEEWSMFKMAEVLDYSDKIQMILDNKIALWDIIKSCSRTTSSDANIENPEFNDLKSFLENHPKIKRVLFNGQKAYKYYSSRKTEFPDNIEYYKLYSTSPQNSVNSFFILKQWKEHILPNIR